MIGKIVYQVTENKMKRKHTLIRKVKSTVSAIKLSRTNVNFRSNEIKRLEFQFQYDHCQKFEFILE